MNKNLKRHSPAPALARYGLRHLAPTRRVPGLAEDVAAGLGATPKRLPPKYFYDAHGSLLYECICTTPEYYPARTEEALLATFALDILVHARPAAIVELGSGASRKTVHLFEACERLSRDPVYVPVDVCATMLEQAAEGLLNTYPWLRIDALAADYLAGLLGLARDEGPTLFAFLGGTIGNFEPQEALTFLRELRAIMRDDDRLLLGADRVKDARLLNAAYNDHAGYTAAFNLNVLRVINRELRADFALDHFEHQAFFNAAAARVEMHLRAKTACRVQVAALEREFAFAGGETILTEMSHKFSFESLQALLANAGFGIERHYQPDNGFFSLVLARPAQFVA